MKNIFTSLLVVLFFTPTFAQLHESEPNDNFGQANKVPLDSAMTGVTCAYPETDYFMIITPFNGVLVVNASITSNSANTGNLAFSLYSKSQSVFQGFNFATAGTTTAYDTIRNGCMAADTFYLVVSTNNANPVCYNYQFSYHVESAYYANDFEPNDNFQQATGLAYNTVTTGNLGFVSQPGNGISTDIYRIVAPLDGTLRIITSAEGGASSLNLTLESKIADPFGDRYPAVGPAGSPADDTLYYGCLASDTFYLALYINNVNDCGISYQVKYDVVPPVYGSDDEPNNSFLTAQELPYNTNTGGHLGFVSTPTNGIGTDYFFIVPPSDGTLRLFRSAEGGASNLDFTFYDKDQNNIANPNFPVGPGGTPTSDTLLWNCVPTDTFYCRVAINNVVDCGVSYQLKYDIISPSFGNDIEPNEGMATAQPVSMNINIDGHLNYGQAGNLDYFVFVKPDSGFLEVQAWSEIGDSAAETFALTLYDHNGQQVTSINPQAGVGGTPTYDSLLVQSLASDTFYLSAAFSSTSCGSYRLKILSPSTIPNSIQEENFTEWVKVWPTISNGRFTLHSDNLSLKEISVFNLSGALVDHRDFSGANASSYQIDLGNSPDGIYLAAITSTNGMSARLRLVLINE